MATLVLGAAGAALGSVFGGPGAVLGRAVGAVFGATLDQSLFGPRRAVVGPRLTELQVQASTEGAVIPRIYGKARLSGQIIWATDYEEVKETEEVGGKGGPSVTTTEYSYFANFAVALCEGPIARIGRMWADGNPLDAGAYTFRVYPGDEAQEPDSLIAAKQSGTAPAYRGAAYVVFERMPLAAFGNRIPQLSFEVFRPVPGLEAHVRAVCVIPGSTEFGYDPLPVIRTLGPGSYAPENNHALRETSDWTVSIDELQALCPNLEWVTLVVAWFGDDLRAAECDVRPKVDEAAKVTRGATWQVSGLTRDEAQEVSRSGERPAYGGSPSDASVLRAIADLKSRGLKVALAPFVLMDIPPGNTLPNPYSGAVGQPAYPWRGEITCDPSPGRAGSPDGTVAIDADAAAFFGMAGPEDFTAAGSTVSYGGPAEWRYRRMVLHYAHLAALAGGVDAFLLGSELRGLTTLRSGPGAYPVVAQLRTLAGDVRAVVGPGAAITYAADWSEYFGHQPADGSGDVFFHLDPLWADPNVDAVGIDLYHPLADWRDGPGHLDEASGRAPYNPDYLRANIRGGEGFEWFYASAADREAQLRTPIADGAYGKPWVYRFKDLEAWWSNLHYDRPGGVENAAPTAWQPQGKPIWLTELGCPAVDRGANQPNVFFDPKSAASALPHYSSGARDDLAQRSYLEAYLRFFDPAHPRFTGGNPVSAVYGGRMLDPAHIHLWAWDARPYPLFPERTDFWSDGENWERGHWLNGRLGAVTIADLVAAVLNDHGFAEYAIGDAYGLVDGAVVNEIASARGTLEPLLQAFRIDAGDAGDRVLFRGRQRPADAAVVRAALVEQAEEALITRRRAQETELPIELVLRAIDPAGDYRVAAAAVRRFPGDSRRTATIELAAILDLGMAEGLADALLRDIWTGREVAELRLPPSALGVEAGDLLSLTEDGRAEALLVERIGDGRDRALELRRIDNAGRAPARRKVTRRPPPAPGSWGPPEVRLIDFAPPDGRQDHAPRLAVFAAPWPGAMAVYSGAAGGGFRLAATLSAPATLGRLDAPLGPGPLWRFDRANAVTVTLFGDGALASLPEIDLLGGGNAAAVASADGSWEVLQFGRAELIGPRQYRLSKLLRGQCGTEAAMRAGALGGAEFVLLNRAVRGLPISRDAVGRRMRLRVGPARDDHAAPSFREIDLTAAGDGLKPFAPVHLRARREVASGDVVLSWIRRTRFGGDSWELAEVPLNEEREAYRLDVLSGDVLIRRVELTSPGFRYLAAEQAADLGGAAPFVVRISQLSVVAGPGAALEEIVDV